MKHRFQFSKRLLDAAPVAALKTSVFHPCSNRGSRDSCWWIAVFILCLLVPAASHACRFNVRDVGFVELGSEFYQLHCFIDADTPETTASSLRAIALATLSESNIKTEVLRAGEDGGSPAHKLLALNRGGTYPWAVLVAPDQRTLPLPLVPGDQSQDEKLWEAFESLTQSTIRAKLQEQIINSYGTVLIVDGPDPARNEVINEMVAGVIKALEANMSQLPKPIKNPPTLIRLSPKSRASESVLLWSLGIDASEVLEPHVAFVYGRGRLVGPVLRGDDIKETRVRNILGTVGLSCECGLDRSWMQGRMIPMSWDDPTLARLAKELGFDPESPAIKMEMSQILAKGQNARTARKPDLNQEDFLLGYREEGMTAGETPDPAAASTSTSNPPPTAPPPLAPPPTNTMNARQFGMVAVVGVIGILALAAGLLILLRGKRH